MEGDAAAAGGSGGGAPEEDAAARAARKRFESLLAVRTKANKGKGAWYWAHLEPVLLPSPPGAGAGAGGARSPASAAKLRCSLCFALFSASNPSRTASEHLKPGACPNFGAAAAEPRPISSLPPPAPSTATSSPFLYHRRSGGRKRPLPLTPPPPAAAAAALPPLSGGKEDLGALALLEESVKKLKSPAARPASPLGSAKSERILADLADWVVESGGAVSASALAHRSFRSFALQIGLPDVQPRRLALQRLSARYVAARADADARIAQAAFFQLALSGWRGSPALVSIVVNLPNGSSVFHRAVVSVADAPAGYAEEVINAAVGEVSAGNRDRCAGIVADRFNSKVLRAIESRNQRMVNLFCQVQALRALVGDFSKGIPIFRKVVEDCSKLSGFVNGRAQVRSLFLKCQNDEHGHSRLLRTVNVNVGGGVSKYFETEFEMVEDVWGFGHQIQIAVLNEDHLLMSNEDPVAREVIEMVKNVAFWNELEAVHSLVRLVLDMAREVEVEMPLVGQCLPLWDELRSKVNSWCSKYGIDKGIVNSVVENRFTKNYHPAWSAAFVLDPVYLSKDTSGKYLPPFRCLTPEQEKDVDRLVTRLVPPEDAHIAVMELMKWRTEGLDPYITQAVQVKETDPSTGKMRMANPQSRRLVWETCLNEYKCLPKVAIRLIFFHATSCAFKPSSTMLRLLSAHGHSETKMKMVFLAAHSKIERRDFSTEEEKDAEFLTDADDATQSETVAESSSV